MRLFSILFFATVLGSLSSFATETESCPSLTPLTKQEASAIGAVPGKGGCVGSQCPVFACKDIPTLPYAAVNNGNFRGTHFGFLGYSDVLTAIQNSDMSNVHIENLTAIDLSGSNLQESVIEIFNGYANLTNTNLRGVTIGKIHDIESITWTGAIYDSTSKFPFDDSFAASKGMIKK